LICKNPIVTTLVAKGSLVNGRLLREMISEQSPHRTGLTLAEFISGRTNVIGEPACP
jgi:hypothetical protein